MYLKRPYCLLLHQIEVAGSGSGCQLKLKIPQNLTSSSSRCAIAFISAALRQATYNLSYVTIFLVLNVNNVSYVPYVVLNENTIF